MALSTLWKVGPGEKGRNKGVGTGERGMSNLIF